MEHYRFRELLQKMQNGSILPEEEEEELREAMEHLSPGQADKLFPVREWEAVACTPPDSKEIAQSQLAYEAVWKQLQDTIPETTVVPVRRHWWRNRWLQAACFIGVLAVAAVVYYSGQSVKPATAQTIAWKKISNVPGERQVVTLPDGSQVYMNGGSILQYPEAFTGNTRQIALVSGEVFLEVQHNKAKPFIIQTGDLRVKVLGTSFSVRNRPEEKQVSVAVKTGKVAFSLGDSSTGNYLLLMPGKKGVFEKQRGTMQETSCSIAGIGGWITGEFVFEDATLQEILGSLEGRYGLHYKVHNSALLNKRFKAGFRGHTPQEMIRILSKMGDFDYTIKDSTLIIH